MVRYEIIPATDAHAAQLAPVMRADDVREIWAAGRRRPLEALVLSAAASRDAQAGLADGRVVCMFGIAEVTFLSDYHVPWMLGAEELPKHARAFLRLNREYVAGARRLYPVLRNWVDARNAASIRWLRWLGFTILPAEAYGVDQLPFHPFEMVRG